MEYNQDESQEQPLSKFYDGLDVAPNGCYPTECSIMNQDCSKPLLSDFIKMKNLTVEISQSSSLG